MDLEALTTAMKTAFETVQTNAMSIITVALPVAVGIAGIFIAVRLGMRFFKSFSK